MFHPYFFRQLVSNTIEHFSSIQSNQVAQTEDLSRMLAAMKETNDGLQSTNSKLDAIERDHLTIARKEVLDWLCPAIDPASNLNYALKKREPDTGAWFLHSVEFVQWFTSSDILWLTGIRKSLTFNSLMLLYLSRRHDCDILLILAQPDVAKLCSALRALRPLRTYVPSLRIAD